MRIPLGNSHGIIVLDENFRQAATKRIVRLPGDGEIALRANSHGGVASRLGHERLFSPRGPVHVVKLKVHVPTVGYRIEALPDDDRVSPRVDGERGELLIADRGAVSLELTAAGRAIGVVALGENAAAAAVLALAGPGDGEIAGRVPGNCREVLVSRRGSVYQKLAADGRTRSAESLGIYPVAAPVLGQTGPGDQKVTIVVHGNRRKGLRVGRRRIDLERIALGRAGTVEALGKHSQAAAIAAIVRPHQHEIAVGVGGHRGCRTLRVGVSVTAPGFAYRQLVPLERERQHAAIFKRFQQQTSQMGHFRGSCLRLMGEAVGRSFSHLP